MKVNRTLMRYSRLIHIYFSVFLLFILIFFAVTGVFLNHPDWLRGKNIETVRAVNYLGALPIEYVGIETISTDFSWFLQHDIGIDIKYAEFERDDDMLFIEQQKPGASTSVEIDMLAGTADVINTQRGIIATLNELHKGRHAKKLWLWLIDFSAVLVVLFSLSGLLILLPQKTRLGKVLLYSLLGLPVFIFAAFY